MSVDLLRALRNEYFREPNMGKGFKLPIFWIFFCKEKAFFLQGKFFFLPGKGFFFWQGKGFLVQGKGLVRQTCISVGPCSRH